MSMKITIDEVKKTVTIVSDLIYVKSKSEMNIKLVENNGFPAAVDGLIYKGKQVKAAVNITIDNPEMDDATRKAKKEVMQLEQAEQRVARLKAKKV